MKRPVVVTLTIVDADTLGEIGRAVASFPLRDDLLTSFDPDKDQDRWVERVGVIATDAYRNAFGPRDDTRVRRSYRGPRSSGE